VGCRAGAVGFGSSRPYGTRRDALGFRVPGLRPFGAWPGLLSLRPTGRRRFPGLRIGIRATPIRIELSSPWEPGHPPRDRGVKRGFALWRHSPGGVRGLPLIHDETVDEWGTQGPGYFMIGPPALLLHLVQPTISIPPRSPKARDPGAPSLWWGESRGSGPPPFCERIGTPSPAVIRAPAH